MTVLLVLLGIALAAINVIIATFLTKGAVDANLLTELLQQQPAYVAYFVATPIVFGLVGALTRPRSAAPESSPTPPEEPAAPPPPAKPSPAAALRLLALLQQEARFIDFIQEDIDAYSDEQVGSAVRSIHAGCRKAINDRINLERVLPQEDGATVTVEKGFDPTEIRLTGKVTGEPPFRGTLEHGGWRATKINLPLPTSDAESEIVAPAEVELA